MVEVVEAVESVEAMIPNEAAIIETVETTEPIISTTMKMRTMISSLLVPSAFRGGGVGAGIRGGAGAGATHTDTTAATVPVMDMADTTAATTTAATVPVMDTAVAVDLEWPSYSAGSLGPAITMAPSMESWGLRLEERYGPTSATVDTKADLDYVNFIIAPYSDCRECQR